MQEEITETAADVDVASESQGSENVVEAISQAERLQESVELQQRILRNRNSPTSGYRRARR